MYDIEELQKNLIIRHIFRKTTKRICYFSFFFFYR
jgi:hypothetical protein